MARAWAGEGRGFGATVIGGAAGLRSKASWGRKARRCKPAGGRRQRGGIVVSAEEPLVIAGAVEDVKHLNRVGADAIDDDVAPVGSPADAGAARHRGMAVWRIRQLLAAIDQLMDEARGPSRVVVLDEIADFSQVRACCGRDEDPHARLRWAGEVKRSLR